MSSATLEQAWDVVLQEERRLAQAKRDYNALVPINNRLPLEILSKIFMLLASNYRSFSWHNPEKSGFAKAYAWISCTRVCVASNHDGFKGVNVNQRQVSSHV